MPNGTAVLEAPAAIVETIELALVGSDSHCTIYSVLVDGECIGSARECAEKCFAFRWGISIPGCYPNWGFKNLADLQTGVRRFVRTGRLED